MLVGLILILLTGAFFIMDAALSGVAEWTGLDVVSLLYDTPLYLVFSTGMSILYEVGLIVFAVSAYLKLRSLSDGVRTPGKGSP